MKKTDLEKLKGKKLDIRKSQEPTLQRFGNASTAARRADRLKDAGSLLNRLLGQVSDKK